MAAWRIHSWDAEKKTGKVVSSHFGPWKFDGAPSDEFEVGEDVLVDLVGQPGSYQVRNVRPARQRQPEGTRAHLFDEINAQRMGDCFVEEDHGPSLKLWLGDCCMQCGPSFFITFRGVTTVKGMSKSGDLDSPLFRLASAAERLDLALDGDAPAYCIVTNHGDGPDGPRVFIVAGSVDIELVARSV